MPARNFLFKLFLLGIFTIIFLFTPKSVFAAWEKYSGNPVLEGSESWDYNSVANQNVKYVDGIYKMWYAGHNGSIWQIGYATSSAGFNWNKHSQPIITPNQAENWTDRIVMEVAHPSVVFSPPNKYEMWYCVISSTWRSGEDRFRVKYAYSDDGIYWNIYPGYILVGTPEKWDRGGINRGISVIKVNNTYKMWYTGVDDQNNWKIGYAFSPDGINWEKYPTPVILPTKSWEKSWLSYPNVFYDGQLYHMFYVSASSDTGENIVYAISTNGTDWEKPNGSINPIITKGIPGDFDNKNIVTPSVLKQGNLYKMWYSGLDGSRWRIGYAEGSLPEPTITPTPTSIPTPFQPLVLLPGLGASWNHEEIFLGENQPQNAWYKTPFRDDYGGLIQTLQNAGYTLGENLFVFYYDWLQPIAQSANDLQNFINTVVSPPPGTKVDLLGHSLGGLVGRTYIQKNPSTHKVDQLITAGSPHKGAPQVYKAWEGADLTGLLGEKERIAAGIVLRLRGFGYPNLVQAIRNLVPSLGNLLFIEDYLKWNVGGVVKPELNMNQQNIWLKELGVSPELLGLTSTIIGTGSSTPRWLKIIERNQIDQLLGRWEDGKPVGEEFASGDRTVLEESAKLLGADIFTLSGLNHGDLVQSAAGQQKILEILGVPAGEIVEQSEIPFEPALVFTVASPVNLRVTDPLGWQIGAGIDPPQIPNATFSAQEKMIVIPEALDGGYKVEVLSENTGGSYNLLIGQLTQKQDIWSSYQDSIGGGETDTYTVPVDNTLTTTDSYLANFINSKLKNLLREIRHQKIDPIVKIKLTAKVWSILGQTAPLPTLLNLGKDKMAAKYVQKAIFKTTEAIDYAEKFNPASLPPLREILDLLGQLHQLLED